MKIYIDIALLALLILDISLGIYNFCNARLTKEDKRIMGKACRFYEDVAREIATVTDDPEQMADDMRALDKLKEKIK